MKYQLIATNQVSKKERVLNSFATREEAKIAKKYYDRFSEIPNKIRLKKNG